MLTSCLFVTWNLWLQGYDPRRNPPFYLGLDDWNNLIEHAHTNILSDSIQLVVNVDYVDYEYSSLSLR